mgnify:CR=1 FL=1
MLLLFGVLAAVFVVPVSAKKLDGVTLTISIPHTDFFVVRDGYDGTPYYPPLQNPVSITSKNSIFYFSYSWHNSVAPCITNFLVNPSYSSVPQYITYDFVIGDGDGECDVSFDELYDRLYIYGKDSSGNSSDINLLNLHKTRSLYVDGEAVAFSSPWSGRVSKRFTVHEEMTSGYMTNLALYPTNGYYEMAYSFSLPGLKVNNVLTAIDRIELKVNDISTTVINIQNGVANINSNLVDMKQQLSNPDSSIWTSGAAAIGEKVTELFTPSADSLTTATEQLKDTVKDKLGGAYDAVDAVTNGAGQMRDKLKNPSPTESITFPGISVPKAGMVEGFTILPSMEVSLPPKLTAVLQPVAGAIVCVLVGMYTLSSLKDMVVCLMSSMSYGEFLHRHKGGGAE